MTAEFCWNGFLFLPEAVILESGMTGLREDRVLLEKDFGDGVVPVISLNQVLEQKEVLSGENVLFLSKDPDLFFNEETRENTCRQIEKFLEEAGKGLERLEDRERTIEADRHYIRGVELDYGKHYAKRSARRVEVASELEAVREKNCHRG